MTVIIPHHTTAEKAVATVDRSLDRLFESSAGGFQVTVQKKIWNGRTMDFALSAGLGFIAVPVTGTIRVDDANITVQCELPGAVKTFIGEDKIRAGVESKIRGLLSA